jgi:hypothetical protein
MDIMRDTNFQPPHEIGVVFLFLFKLMNSENRKKCILHQKIRWTMPYTRNREILTPSPLEWIGVSYNN